MRLEDFRRLDVPTRDGLTVAAFDSGPIGAARAGDPGRATFFLVNGLGGNLSTWRFLVEHFTTRGHRVVTWDYRGLFASRFDGVVQARNQKGEIPLDMAAHRDDAVRVLDAVGVDRVVSFGWSMGVLLNWDLLRHHPERIDAVVQICGAAGRVIETTALGPIGARIALPMMDLMRIATTKARPFLQKVVSSPLAIRVAAALGAVAPSIDTSLANSIATEYVSLDFDVYNRILAGLGAADARDFLAHVDKPVLLVAGDRDVMTPVGLSRDMASIIPGAELLVVRGGSHYLPIEFPGALNEAVEGFLERRVETARSGGIPAGGAVPSSASNGQPKIGESLN